MVSIGVEVCRGEVFGVSEPDEILPTCLNSKLLSASILLRVSGKRVAPFEVQILIFLLIYITCKGVPRRSLPVGQALGSPGSYLRACEGSARRSPSRLSVALLSLNLSFDVSLSGLDVVVTLDVVDELFLRSLPDGLVSGGRRVFPTVWARRLVALEIVELFLGSLSDGLVRG